jgi:hypothetical protein
LVYFEFLDSITDIYQQAFASVPLSLCTKLPNSLNLIGNAAFSHTESKFTEINAVKIDPSAFASMRVHSKTLILGDRVEIIGQSSFASYYPRV